MVMMICSCARLLLRRRISFRSNMTMKMMLACFLSWLIIHQGFPMYFVLHSWCSRDIDATIFPLSSPAIHTPVIVLACVSLFRFGNCINALWCTVLPLCQPALLMCSMNSASLPVPHTRMFASRIHSLKLAGGHHLSATWRTLHGSMKTGVFLGGHSLSSISSATS